MVKIYLDSSAIVKRYVQERGTDSTNLVYGMADSKEISIAFSFWNIGESIGVLDQYCQRHWITKQQHDSAVRNLSGECLRLMALEALELIPTTLSVIAESWNLIRRYHIYQADALQIASFRLAQASVFLTADSSLLDAAKKENLSCADIEKIDDVKKALLN